MAPLPAHRPSSRIPFPVPVKHQSKASIFATQQSTIFLPKFAVKVTQCCFNTARKNLVSVLNFVLVLYCTTRLQSSFSSQAARLLRAPSYKIDMIFFEPKHVQQMWHLTFTLYAYWLTFTSRGGEDGVITANKAAKSQATALDIFKDTWGYI